MQTVFEGTPSACVLLAIASIPEGKPKALKACRRRTIRIVDKLSGGPHARTPEQQEAIDAMGLRCRLCRQCAGLGITQREPQLMEG